MNQSFLLEGSLPDFRSVTLRQLWELWLQAGELEFERMALSLALDKAGEDPQDEIAQQQVGPRAQVYLEALFNPTSYF